MMKGKNRLRISSMIIAVCLLLSACGGGEETKNPSTVVEESSSASLDNTWQYEPTIPEPLTDETSGDPVILGNFDTHSIEITIPKGAFEKETRVKLFHPEGDVNFSQEEMDPDGVPVSFVIEGEQLRSDLPMRVKVKVDTNKLNELDETEGYKGVHYHEDMGWTYKDAVEVNVEAGYIVYETYHNFLLGTAELTQEERIEEFAKDKAMEAWGVKQMGDEVENVTREMVIEIMRTQFNANNESEIGKIADAVIGEMDLSPLEYGKLAMNLKNGDYAAVSESVAGMLGDTLAESMESGTLETLFGSAGTAAAAAGHLWEGDYSGAGRMLAQSIAENTAVYKVAKVWIDVVDTRINNWRNDEVEKAYQIFVNGASSRIPWGYNVEAGKFDELYDQMRGVARQIEIDAINRYASIRGIHPDEVSEEKRNEIKREAKESLREQFKERSKQEEELRQLEEDQMEIIRQLDEWGLLKKGSSWYPYDTSIEQMLHRLHGQIERIMVEVGRYDLVIRRGDLHDQTRGMDHIGELKDSEILVEHLAELIRIRYVNGEEEYQKKLIEMGYMILELEAGTYTGTLVLTDTPVVKALRQSLEDPDSVPEYEGPNDEQCEEIDLMAADVQQQIREIIDQIESMKGTPIPLTLRVSKSEESNEFTATLKADYESAFPGKGCEEISVESSVQVKTSQDQVTFTQVLEEGAGSWVYQGTVLPGGKLQGTMRLTTSEIEYREYVGVDYLMSGDWNVQK